MAATSARVSSVSPGSSRLDRVEGERAPCCRDVPLDERQLADLLVRRDDHALDDGGARARHRHDEADRPRRDCHGGEKVHDGEDRPNPEDGRRRTGSSRARPRADPPCTMPPDDEHQDAKRVEPGAGSHHEEEQAARSEMDRARRVVDTITRPDPDRTGEDVALPQ